MKRTKLRWLIVAVAIAGLLTLGACTKEVAPPPPPPPPPPAAPMASLTATPGTIQRGETSALVWTTANATDVSIEGLGGVEGNGSRSVSPTESTTYKLIAKGPGGAQEAIARVTVTEPPPPPPPAATLPSEEELFGQHVKDIYFDFDKYNIRDDQQVTTHEDGQFLAAHPDVRLMIEGHCDERGSIEYNLALGDNRANSAKQALVSAGVSGYRIHTISYGKERPVCLEPSDECWQQNRRAHFVFQK